MTLTDVHTQWTETRAVWNKGEHGVQNRIEEVERALPFDILGFDLDNGGEFINWHLAEQKNWTHVRQLGGYGRLEKPEQAEHLNTLYVKEWNLFRNFFCPTMKHIKTEVIGSRKKRIFDKPATPFERLKACADSDPVQIARLEELKAKLRPFVLKQGMEITQTSA